MRFRERGPMEDFSKFNRFLGVLAFFALVAVGIVVFILAGERGVHEWDWEYVKSFKWVTEWKTLHLR